MNSTPRHHGDARCCLVPRLGPFNPRWPADVTALSIVETFDCRLSCTPPERVVKNGKEAHCAYLPFVSCHAVGHLGSPLEDFQCRLIPRRRTCRLNGAAILEVGGNELGSATVMAKVTRDGRIVLWQ